MRQLCRTEEIPEGGCKSLGHGIEDAMFAVRWNGTIHLYRNRCPHAGAPLNWMPDRFLDRSRQHLHCKVHGALFEVETGTCFSGPCPGQKLEAIPFEIRGDHLCIDV